MITMICVKYSYDKLTCSNSKEKDSTNKIHRHDSISKASKRENEENRKDQTKVRAKNEQTNQIVFPWEPLYSEINNLDNDGKNNHDSVIVADIECKRTKKVNVNYDFIASMTFANAHLRKPSCPCCQ